MIIEIKRSGRPVELEELQRFQTYKQNLGRSNMEVEAIMIASSFNIDEDILNGVKKSENFEIYEWNEILQKTKQNYGEYIPLLDAETKNSVFTKLEHESAEHKKIKDGNIRRSKKEREAGIKQNEDSKSAVIGMQKNNS